MICTAYWVLVLKIVVFQDMPRGTGHGGEVPGGVRMPGGMSMPVDTVPGVSWHWLFP